MTMKAMQDLYNAIIVQAVKDYRSALAGHYVAGRSPLSIIRECERFFRSDRFETMTTAIGGETLIRRLREEARLKEEKANARRTRSRNAKPH